MTDLPGCPVCQAIRFVVPDLELQIERGQPGHFLKVRVCAKCGTLSIPTQPARNADPRPVPAVAESEVTENRKARNLANVLCQQVGKPGIDHLYDCLRSAVYGLPGHSAVSAMDLVHAMAKRLGKVPPDGAGEDT